MAVTDGLALPIPELTESADGPGGFGGLANAIEDYLYDRILPTGVTRSPMHHWTAGSGFPSGASLKRGDHFFHTTYNVLCAYDGTNWRQAEIPTVAANDTTPGFYDGQLRDRAGVGLERWNATSSTWLSAGLGINAPVMKLYRSAAQVVASGAFTTLVWDVIDFDTAGMAVAGSAVVTCQRSGYYWLQAGWDANANAGGRRGIEITRSRSGGAYTGVSVGRMTGNTTTQDAGVECSGSVSLLSGDLLHVDAWQDSGASVNTGNPVFGPTMFSAMWLRPL